MRGKLTARLDQTPGYVSLALDEAMGGVCRVGASGRVEVAF